MKTVTVYSTAWCGYCTAAKRLLAGEGIPFQEIDLDGDDALRREIAKKAQMRTVPMIFIGDECVGGYSELTSLHQSGQLLARLSDDSGPG